MYQYYILWHSCNDKTPTSIKNKIYRTVLISASFLLTLHIVVYMKYVPNIQKGKVKIHPKDDKFKIVSSKESSLETK